METAGGGPDDIGVPGAAGEADDLVDELIRWLAETRVDAAASARARERWLRQQLDEEATLAGILLDLAEGDRQVVVVGPSGRRHIGIVRAVADDFCALRTTGGDDVLLGFAGISSVQAVRSSVILSGSRPAALAMTLGDALGALVGDRLRVLVVARSGSALAGELRSVGLDVVVLRPDGEAGTVYVPLATIAEVTIIR